jgi:hypothetical protein
MMLVAQGNMFWKRCFETATPASRLRIDENADLFPRTASNAACISKLGALVVCRKYCFDTLANRAYIPIEYFSVRRD